MYDCTHNPVQERCENHLRKASATSISTRSNSAPLNESDRLRYCPPAFICVVLHTLKCKTSGHVMHALHSRDAQRTGMA